MQYVVGCSVTQRHFDQWTHLLVTDAAPYFLPNELLSSIPADIPRFPRQRGIDQQLPLAVRDSYTVYRVDQACQHVVFLSDATVHNLTSHVREQLLYAQWCNGRGHMYDWERFSAWLPSAMSEQLNGYTVTTEAGRKGFLGTTLWYALTAERQENWLRHFVADQHHPYPTLPLDSIELPARRALQLQSLANSFAFTSGSNCFATTLAAITEPVDHALTISTLWLHQDMFLQGLATRGYVLNDSVDACTEDLSDAVIVWRDDAGTLRHACWLIGRGIVLNKNGQAWYDPRHLATIRDVLAYWEEDAYQVQVYTRSAA